MRRIFLLMGAALLSGCAVVEQLTGAGAGSDGQVALSLAPEGMPRPPARPPGLTPGAAAAPPTGARTVEDFDTTDDAARSAAVADAAEAGARRLGRTVASLGAAAEPGIWIKTPLVARLTQGRADYPAAGTSIAVELRPAGGAPGAGSQVSLAAMRLLEAPLTGLPELILFAD
jgi:hypothetical protein